MEKLGIEPSLLLAQLINFSIIVVVLTRFLYKPILGMLAKRKKEIEEGLAITERMRAEEEKFGLRKEKLLAEARKEARVILDDAKKQGKDIGNELVSAAHKEAGEIMHKAKQEAVATHESLSGEIRKEAVELAATMARRLIVGVLSPADQHKLISKQLSDLGKVK